LKCSALAREWEDPWESPTVWETASRRDPVLVLGSGRVSVLRLLSLLALRSR
jgi:hypothetical protein